MSIKNKVLAVAATMTMVGGASVVGLLPAQAATPSCGTGCAEGYGLEYGSPFVWDVLRQGEKVNQPIILFRASNADPAEDFTISATGLVSTFGVLSTAVSTTYADDTAFEWEYSPYGVDSGLCIGVGAAAAVDNTPVELEPCGVSANTVWIDDSGATVVATPLAGVTTEPLINGSGTNFDTPYVLHYPGSAYPTDMPRVPLTTYTLQRYSAGAVYDNEVWSTELGTPALP